MILHCNGLKQTQTGNTIQLNVT